MTRRIKFDLDIWHLIMLWVLFAIPIVNIISLIIFILETKEE